MGTSMAKVNMLSMAIESTSNVTMRSTNTMTTVSTNTIRLSSRRPVRYLRLSPWTASGRVVVTAAAPWFEELPDRLARELSDLAEVGATWQVDEEARSKGVLKLSPLMWPFDGILELSVDFPDLYPYFRPEVGAPRLRLPQHQAPAGGYLCLIGRDSRHWHVGDTLAVYLKQRLPLVLTAVDTTDSRGAASTEEQQGEPFSDYLPYFGWAMLMVDGAWTIPSTATDGELLLGLDPRLSARDGLLRGAVLQVRDQNQQILGGAEPSFGKLFTQSLTAPWRRVGRIQFHRDPAAIVAELLAENHVAFPPLQACGTLKDFDRGLPF